MDLRLNRLVELVTWRITTFGIVQGHVTWPHRSLNLFLAGEQDQHLIDLLRLKWRAGERWFRLHISLITCFYMSPCALSIFYLSFWAESWDGNLTICTHGSLLGSTGTWAKGFFGWDICILQFWVVFFLVFYLCLHDHDRMIDFF